MSRKEQLTRIEEELAEIGVDARDTRNMLIMILNSQGICVDPDAWFANLVGWWEK